MTLLQRSAHATYCPYKGDCAYFSIPSGRELAINAVWTYEAPYQAIAAIRNRLAFYPERVELIEECAEREANARTRAEDNPDTVRSRTLDR